MNVFDLYAKLTLDDSSYDKGLENAEKKGSTFGQKLKSAMGVGVKAIGAGIGAASTALAALTKNAIEGYADYEQLVGGVETLFGAGGQSIQEYAKTIGTTVAGAEDAYGKLMTAQETVLRNADEAYKTAGMSANEYMETVTSFSAALIGSLDGDTLAAANAADVAIRDMSDNANKMGTSMDAIQSAYQGFAKQNYTMLDNLKLGYGGTKTEMERLLKDATALSGVEYDIDSLSDVYDAIHVIQTDLGITGTTAKEASTTISGSIGSMKSAFKNLVAGLGDSNADLGKLFDNLIESAETAFGNILPVAEKAITGIATVIEKLAPVVAEKLPGLVEQVLPPLLSSATTLVNALVEALPTILTAITEALPEIIVSVTSTLADMSPQLVEAGILLTIALMQGLIEAIPVLVEKIPEIVKAIWETIKAHAPEMLQASNELINQLLIGIGNLLGKILAKGKEIVSKIGEGIKTAAEKALQWGKDVVNKVVQGISNAFDSLRTAGLNLVQGIWNGISAGYDWITGRIRSWVGNVLSYIKSLFGIKSPSTVMRDQVGKFLALGIGEGFVDEMPKVERMMQEAMPEVSGLVGSADLTVKSGSTPYAQIVGLLQEILASMGYDIVLDDGTLVGRMDKMLGRRTMQRARGNA